MQHRDRRSAVAKLFSDVTTWAGSQLDVLGIAVCGSYARGSADADSDVDIIVLCTDQQARISDKSWLNAFGTAVSVEQEDYGLVQSLRTMYDNSLEVEFGLCEPVWAEPPIDSETATVISAGLIVLYDQDELISVAQQWAREHRGTDSAATS